MNIYKEEKVFPEITSFNISIVHNKKYNFHFQIINTIQCFGIPTGLNAKQ